MKLNHVRSPHEPKLRITAESAADEALLREMAAAMKTDKIDAAFYSQGLGDWHLVIWLGKKSSDSEAQDSPNAAGQRQAPAESQKPTENQTT